jgi:cell division inhibitor SepF
MASALQRMMVYLGLGPDEEYEDYGAPAASPQPPAGGASLPLEPAAPEPTGLHRQDPDQPEPQVEPALSAVRPLDPPEKVENASAKTAGPGEMGSVRPMAISSAKPQVVSPHGFDQAQEVGDRYRNNMPVIINLQGTDRDLARRIIDFASGLCYALGGQMERVSKDVYLLTPADVQVSDEERRQLSERGLHDR